MFKRLLIANRGEIACRVIRTARRLGVRCIGVCSDADADALHVAMADEAHRIGPPPARESYLDLDAILGAAERARADAIHPGYGFLSENADFAEACAARGIVFVGPPPEAIRAMGSKSGAKRLMAEAGVPLVPGYHGADQSPDRLRREAEAIGWPVLLKASAGGGGRGMRAVERAEDFDAALAGAKREAAAAFGDDSMLVERYVAEPRHVEVQVFADRHGRFVHLFERDCSAQRRHQKVVEEAPAPGVGGGLRAAMCDAAIAAARAIGYEGAGTVEFLLDRGGAFWFMEMNTRLQVEHPVTELVTGTDLVEWQLRVAVGEPLPLAQDEIALRGHAVEARLYAEDPARGFLPSTGRLVHLRLPESDAWRPGGRQPVREGEAGAPDGAGGGAGVRVDAGVRAGDSVSMYYDPMIAKVVAWGPDRDSAAGRLADALAETEAVGVTVNADFLHALVTHPRFLAADVHTRFIEERMEDLAPAEADLPTEEDLAVAAWAMAVRDDVAATPPFGAGEGKGESPGFTDRAERGSAAGSGSVGAVAGGRGPGDGRAARGGGGDPWSPWNRRDHWRLNGSGERIVRLRPGGDGGEVVEAAVYGGAGGVDPTGAGGAGGARGYAVRLPSGREVPVRGAPAAGGRWEVDVDGTRRPATFVAEGERLTVFRNGRRRVFVRHDPGAASGGVEMAGGLTAPMPGRVVSVLVEPGQRVRAGQALLVLEAMKMEHTLTAPADGTVEEVRFAPGDLVDEATELVVLTADGAAPFDSVKG